MRRIDAVICQMNRATMRKVSAPSDPSVIGRPLMLVTCVISPPHLLQDV
jgi:hypothetical protein